MDAAAVKGLPWFVIALIAVALSLNGLLLGMWWMPFIAGLLVGVTVRRARVAIPMGGLVGLIGWGVPLVAEQVRYGLGPTASSLAAIMGFTQPAIPVILTCLVGLLLGLTGAWLASAVRSLAMPTTR
jgi:hypothetical protein